MLDDQLKTMPPHGQAIGMELVGYEGSKVTVKVPYAGHLVGDPDTGVIHGGVITATLDNASGWAIRMRSDNPEVISMATLDIRIDYMRPAEPHQDLLVESECFKITKNVAFVRALAHQGNPDDPVATSIASFMLGTPSGPRS